MMSPGTELVSALESCAEVWAAHVVPPVGGFQVVSSHVCGNWATGLELWANPSRESTKIRRGRNRYFVRQDCRQADTRVVNAIGLTNFSLVTRLEATTCQDRRDGSIHWRKSQGNCLR